VSPPIGENYEKEAKIEARSTHEIREAASQTGRIGIMDYQLSSDRE
jgi:hypothetical protein